MKKYLSGILLLIFTCVMLSSGCKKGGDNTSESPTPPPVSTDPALTDFAPTSGLHGSLIYLNGKNFSPVIANNKVTVNGVNAVINSASETQIVATVPKSATTGKIVLITKGTTFTSAIDFTIPFAATTSKYIKTAADFTNIAIDTSGNIYAYYNNVIYKLSPPNLSTIVAGIPGTTGPFKGLSGIAVDASGNVYVCNAKYEIDKITPNGTITRFAGTGTAGTADGSALTAQFSSLAGLLFDASGTLYVGDAARIRKISTSGQVTTFAGSTVSGIADGQGTAAKFQSLGAMAFDTDGNLCVIDYSANPLIRKITPSAVVTTLAGGSNTANFTEAFGASAQFHDAEGIATDFAGNIFVCDYAFSNGASTIRRVSNTGYVTTFLTGNYPPVANAYAINLDLLQPISIAKDKAGDLYINNSGSQVITKVTF